MALIPQQPAGGSLCVLGAGKCDDLDLPRLADRFAAIHLVDIDGEAMERARDRQPARVRDAIVLHGDIDVSGLLRSEEHTSELQSQSNLVCRLLLEKIAFMEVTCSECHVMCDVW